MAKAEAQTVRKGAAAVEMALVAPVLIILLFGIIEFGVLMSTLVQLNNLTREGARAASVGATVSGIQAHMDGAAAMLDETQITTTMDYRILSTGMWTPWVTLTDNGTSNDAPTGAQIRIRTQYPHQLMVGALFSDLLGATDNRLTLTASATMRRE